MSLYSTFLRFAPSYSTLNKYIMKIVHALIRVPKKCLYCSLRSSVISWGLIGMTPLRNHCKCPNSAREYKINYSIVILASVIAVVSIVTCLNRLITKVIHCDSMWEVDCVSDLSIILFVGNSAVATLFSLHKTRRGMSLWTNTDIIIDYYNLMSVEQNLEQKMIDEVYYNSIVCLLIAVSNCSVCFFYYILSENFAFLAMSIAAFVSTMQIFSINVITRMYSTVIKEFYEDIKNILGARCLVRTGVLTELLKLMKYHRTLFLSYGLFDTLSGHSMYTYYLMISMFEITSAYILLIKLFNGTFLDLLSDTHLYFFLVPIYMVMLFYCTLGTEVGLTVGENLSSFLHRFPISGLTRQEANMIEVIMECVDHRRLVLNPAGLYTYSVKLVPATTHSFFAYILVGLQFYQQYIRTMKE